MISTVAEVKRITVDEAAETSVQDFLNWYCFKRDMNTIEQKRLEKIKARKKV